MKGVATAILKLPRATPVRRPMSTRTVLAGGASLVLMSHLGRPAVADRAPQFEQAPTSKG